MSRRRYAPWSFFFLLLVLSWTRPPLAAPNDLDIDTLIFEPVLLRPGAEPEVLAGSHPVTRAPAGARRETSPPSDSLQALSDISAYRDRIETLIASEGPYAQGLVQEYFALGRAYQISGQHEAAIEAFEEAQYINRISAGLVTGRLFELVRAEVTSHLALGDLDSANREQQYLYYLGREQYGNDSLEIVPVLDSLGDWHMDNFSLGIVRKPVVSISINNNGMGSPTPDPRFMALGSLYQARSYYSQAIRNMVLNDNVYDPTLLDLESKLIETIYLAAHRQALMRDPHFYVSRRHHYTGSRIGRNELSGYTRTYIQGEQVYKRMRQYLYFQSGATAFDMARVMLEEADWHLLFDHHGRAVDLYMEVADYLRERGVPESRINEYLAPALPVQVPVFTPPPHSRERFGIASDTRIAYEGYVDVSFTLSRYGSVRDLEFKGGSANTEDAIRKRLRRLLYSLPFRPRVLHAGEEPEVFTLRYYFTPYRPEYGPV